MPPSGEASAPVRRHMLRRDGPDDGFSVLVGGCDTHSTDYSISRLAPYKPVHRLGGHSTTNAFPTMASPSIGPKNLLSWLELRLSPITKY